jgi:RNA polymerase sigma factor (sigma-70 family)
MVALGERATPSGQELLAEFIQYGHQRPFEEIVRRYAGMVFNVCFRITKDKHEAEDAVQAVFLTLALQAKRGADIKALGPWLQQVAKRLSLDVRRSKKRRKTREERHHIEQTVRRESILDDALPSADLDELKTVLHEELQKLPAKYRMPLILHYFGGLTRDEMAAELNCKPSTLGVRIFRGREMLAGRLSGRGIHISGVTLAALLGYAVKRAVSDTLIASTSHAATAMIAGHDGAGYASAHVIGLTRRATSAVAFGKFKLTALTLLLAGTSLGAGAQALQLLPTLNVQRILSNQINRIIAPLFGTFNRPLLSQATSIPAAKTSASGSTIASAGDDVPQAMTTSNAPVRSTPQPPNILAPVIAAAKPAADIASGENSGKPILTDWSGSRKFSPAIASASSTETSAAPAAISASDDASAGSSGAGSGGGGLGSVTAHNSPLPPLSGVSSASQSQYSNVVVTSNDLVIGASAIRNSGLLATASPTAVVQVPTLNRIGTVTETSTGILSGWGTIARTGTLFINGEVVGDGSGIPRTLNLSDISAISTGAISTGTVNTGASDASASSDSARSVAQPKAGNTSASSVTDSTNAAAASGLATAGSGDSDSAVTYSAFKAAAPMTLGSINPPTHGWYAINHGGVCLPLLPSTSQSSVVTWGDDPNASVLTLTNSVRLSMKTGNTADGDSDDPMATQLSLLSPDRSDIPGLSEITGATIGVWQVDGANSQVGTIEDADLSICYDSLLANAMGALQNSVELWTFNDPSNSWEPVNPASFALDTVDHLVYGSADDFSYFAVTATPSPDANLVFDRANQLASIGDPTSAPAGSQVVPEPTGLALLAMGGGLLGRRRRRTK